MRILDVSFSQHSLLWNFRFKVPSKGWFCLFRIGCTLRSRCFPIRVAHPRERIERVLLPLVHYWRRIISIAVCHLLRSGVAAIFGPQSPHTASHVQSICDTMEIPHLETRWDYRLRRESCLVNLYPHPTTLSKVRRQLISFLLCSPGLRQRDNSGRCSNYWTRTFGKPGRNFNEGVLALKWVFVDTLNLHSPPLRFHTVRFLNLAVIFVEVTDLQLPDLTYCTNPGKHFRNVTVKQVNDEILSSSKFD